MLSYQSKMLKDPLLLRAKGSSPPSCKELVVMSFVATTIQKYSGGRILLTVNSLHLLIYTSQNNNKERKRGAGK